MKNYSTYGRPTDHYEMPKWLVKVRKEINYDLKNDPLFWDKLREEHKNCRKEVRQVR